MKLWMGQTFFKKIVLLSLFSLFFFKHKARKRSKIKQKNGVPTDTSDSVAPVGCLFQITFHNVRVVNNFLFKNVGISTGRSSFICLAISCSITGQQISLLCKFFHAEKQEKSAKKAFLIATNRFYVFSNMQNS